MDESQPSGRGQLELGPGPCSPEGKFWIYPERTGEPREGLSEVRGGGHMGGFVLGEDPWGGCVAARPAGRSQSSRWPAHEIEGRVEPEM